MTKRWGIAGPSCLFVALSGVLACGQFVDRLSPAEMRLLKARTAAAEQISAHEVNRIHLLLLDRWVRHHSADNKLYLKYKGIAASTGEATGLAIGALRVVHQHYIEGDVGDPISWSLIRSETHEAAMEIWVSLEKTAQTVEVIRIGKKKRYVNLAEVEKNQAPDKPLKSLNGFSPRQLLDRLRQSSEPLK